MFYFIVFRAVHRTFFTRDGHHIASFSDDRTISLWDISSQEISGHYEGYHTVINSSLLFISIILQII